ncbi:MAG: phosphatidylinositol-specific phospholipase C domain-containing protein [Clostridia bacterium]|nr:phosphatidylinositol-specific phospholipase C domain-containing protein [Clostridia bacterium]
MEKKHCKAKKLLHLLWIIPLIVVLAFATLMYVIPAFETVDGTKVEGSADWMAKLDDGMYLSDVVLPGTHDSATKNVQLAFITKCQALTIGEQLEAGFRYLDIRLAANGEKLKLMHGFTNCTTSGWPWAAALNANDVLDDCYAFLKAHPTETIVFAVKQEYGSETPEKFEAMLRAYVEQNPDAWLLTDRIPTVGEARGKIVLLRHYENASDPVPTLGIPCYWQTQNGHGDVSLNAATHRNGNYTLIVQDRYEYGEQDKLNAFREGLKATQTGETFLSIHFLSTKGASAVGHPYGLAKALNAELLSSTDALAGWIVVDFGSAKLAERIYRTNFAE